MNYSFWQTLWNKKLNGDQARMELERQLSLNILLQTLQNHSMQVICVQQSSEPSFTKFTNIWDTMSSELTILEIGENNMVKINRHLKTKQKQTFKTEKIMNRIVGNWICKVWK